MTQYEFQCPACQGVFTVLRDPHKRKHANCPECGTAAERVFAYSGFRVAEPNGPDGINLGLGRHFKSNRERDYFADSNGLRRLKDG